MIQHDRIISGIALRVIPNLFQNLKGRMEYLFNEIVCEINKGGIMELKIVKIEKPEDVNVILGQSHFIKTIEDVYETLITTVPNIKFGMAFCESSGKKLIRYTGTDEEMEKLAIKNAKMISAGHSFIIFLKNAYPINIMRALKGVQEIVNIFAATSNPLKVIIAEEEKGRGILGVIDGEMPVGIENNEEKQERIKFLRDIGYKIGK